VAAVASWDETNGKKYARKYSIPTVHAGSDGYQSTFALIVFSASV